MPDEDQKIVIEFMLGEDRFLPMGAWKHLTPTFQIIPELGYQLTHAV